MGLFSNFDWSKWQDIGSGSGSSIGDTGVLSGADWSSATSPSTSTRSSSNSSGGTSDTTTSGPQDGDRKLGPRGVWLVWSAAAGRWLPETEYTAGATQLTADEADQYDWSSAGGTQGSNYDPSNSTEYNFDTIGGQGNAEGQTNDGPPEAPDAGQHIAAVDLPPDTSDERAAEYDDIKYEENLDEINSRFNDMMSLYNWDDIEKNVMESGYADLRSADLANARLGQSLGGAYGAAQRQANIATLRTMMDEKQDFLEALSGIQYQRHQALQQEHELAQKYGIETATTQANIKAEEDIWRRNLAAELGVSAAELKEEMDKLEYGYSVDAYMAESTAEENTIDMSSELGMPGFKDPSTGNVELSDGRTIEADLVNTIDKIETAAQYSNNVIDIAEDLTDWVADHPGVSTDAVYRQARDLYLDAFTELGDELNKDEGWPERMMKKLFGANWENDFSGVIGNAGFRYVPSAGAV